MQSVASTDRILRCLGRPIGVVIWTAENGPFPALTVVVVRDQGPSEVSKLDPVPVDRRTCDPQLQVSLPTVCHCSRTRFAKRRLRREDTNLFALNAPRW